MSVPGEQLDNTADIARRIAERRASGNAPRPEGDPPDGLRDDDYQPGQNVHHDDDRDDDAARQPDPQALEREALGQDPDEDEDEGEQPGAEDEQELEAGEQDEPTDADDVQGQDVELAFDSVDELAELLGMETDDLLAQVKISTLVDGENRETTLAELRKGHQLESSFTRKNQAWVQQKKDWDQHVEQRRAEIEDQFAISGQVLNLAQQQLTQDFQSINWDQLQSSDPQQWAVKRQQFGERQARLNQIMQQTTNAIQQHRAKAKAEDEAAEEKNLEQQHQMLMAAVPAWKDENKAAREGAKVAEYLLGLGYTKEELDNINDHRLILLGRAALGMTGPMKKKLDLARKKVDKVQNLVRPGNGTQRRAEGNAAFTKKAQEAKAKLAKTGSTVDAQQAILARRQARAASQKRGRRSRV